MNMHKGDDSQLDTLTHGDDAEALAQVAGNAQSKTL